MTKTLLTLLVVVLALSAPASAEPLAIGVRSVTVQNEPILVGGELFKAYCTAQGSIFINAQYVYSDWDLKRLLAHEMSHAYCGQLYGDWSHGACFRDRNRLLAKSFGVMPLP